MTSYLYSQNIRIFDYGKFANPYREEVRSNAEQIAKDNDIAIEFVRKSHIRKEDLVKEYWTNEDITMALFIYYLLWKVVTVTDHGTTKQRGRRF